MTGDTVTVSGLLKNISASSRIAIGVAEKECLSILE
jgi:hypothetical protein